MLGVPLLPSDESVEDRAVEIGDVAVEAAMSTEYIAEMVRRVELFLDEGASLSEWLAAAGITVSTIQGKCGSASDEKTLVKAIRSKEGGFRRLDNVIQYFRTKMLPREVVLQAMQQHSPVFMWVAKELQAAGLIWWERCLRQGYGSQRARRRSRTVRLQT